jgi:hypothetical protein
MPPAARRRRGVENRLDPGGDTDAAEGDVAAGDPLGELDDVRLPPQCSSPNQRPVRPKPVITSSLMKSTSWRSQISRTRRK